MNEKRKKCGCLCVRWQLWMLWTSVYIAIYAQHTKRFAVQNDIQSRCCAIKLQISTTKANEASNSCKLFFEHFFAIAMAFTSSSTHVSFCIHFILESFIRIFSITIWVDRLVSRYWRKWCAFATKENFLSKMFLLFHVNQLIHILRTLEFSIHKMQNTQKHVQIWIGNHFPSAKNRFGMILLVDSRTVEVYNSENAISETIPNKANFMPNRHRILCGNGIL